MLNLAFSLSLILLPFSHMMAIEDITFSNLNASYNNEEVRVKGFLFMGDFGEWLISSEPDLKSCCIGKISKKKSQIFLDGHYDKNLINQVVSVEGIYKESVIRHLKNAKVTPLKNSSTATYLTYLFLLVFLVLLVRYLRNKQVNYN